MAAFLASGMDCVDDDRVLTSLDSLIEEAVVALLGLIIAGHSLVLTYSGGKDSTTTTILGIEAIRRAAVQGVRQARHFVTSASTGVENPSVESHLLDMHEAIGAFVELHQLPVDVKLARPSLASTFVVSTIGRGTLPRFPENGKKRSCSTDWKVLPQRRLASALADASQADGFRETVAILGTRFSESGVRSRRMTARGESAMVPVRDAAGMLTLSPICDWDLTDVWETLSRFLDPHDTPFPSFADTDGISRLLELYRDGNEGTCGVITGDGGNKAPCGPRFGCWLCTVVARDKSMESMLSHPEYQHLAGLNAFRSLLLATQWDMGRRELVGRKISAAGYVPVRPDVYSFHFRHDLLAYLLTLDVVEEERAEALAEAIAAGDVPDTPASRRLAEVQFEHVSLSQLSLVDFHWSLHHYAPHAFPAVSLWYEIKVLGRRYPVPTLAMVPAAPIPSIRWYKVGAFDQDAPADGLRDYLGEQWGPYLHPDRPLHNREVDGGRTVWFEEGEALEVDAERACLFITCEYEAMMIASRQHPAIESARFWLDQAIVRLPVGMAGRYQHIAKRGQYFARLAERANLTPSELDQHLVSHSVTDAEHGAMLAEVQALAAELRPELF